VKPRLQADNDLRNSIRTGVLRREPAIDFQSALAARLDDIPDPEVLSKAMAMIPDLTVIRFLTQTSPRVVLDLGVFPVTGFFR
jgi:hypothetical protein